MTKFLSIPVTSEGNQLVSCNDIKIIEKDSNTVLKVYYGGGKVTDITHGTDTTLSMRDAIQDAVVSNLQRSWTNVSIQVENLPFAVSAIAIT
tara:strand:+ start:1183 stop:1458 length:276 start_codon:yes stop_codon:yes gene_type:complete